MKLRQTLPHVTIAHRSHSNYGPPERIRDGLEEGQLRSGLGEVHGTREENDTCNRGAAGWPITGVQ